MNLEFKMSCYLKRLARVGNAHVARCDASFNTSIILLKKRKSANLSIAKLIETCILGPKAREDLMSSLTYH